MQRLHFILPILILTAFLAGCAPQATAQPEEVKALENPTPTDPAEQPTPTDTA